MGLIVRAVDEMRFGVRALDLDALESLASIWSDINCGITPSEAALRLAKQND